VAATGASRPARLTLSQVLEQSLAPFRARTGVYVKNLETGEEAGVRADEAFNSFSVIKLGIMVRAYHLSDQKQLNLDERIEVKGSDLRDGSGMLYTFDAGLRVTLRDLITQMIITSDNTATDILLDRVGGLEELNAWLTSAGFPNTKMVQSTLSFFRQPLELVDPKYRSLPPEDVFAYWWYPYEISDRLMQSHAAASAALQKAAPFATVLPKMAALWNDDRKYWLGSMTARETGVLLEAIDRGTLVSRGSSAQMKRILIEQREGRLRLPHYLQWPDYFVAHKTGDGPPVIANDVGIVYGPAGSIVISFFSAANTEPYGEHEDRIGHLARAVVDYFAEAKSTPSK
jgi:beta-lactamase class A